MHKKNDKLPNNFSHSNFNDTELEIIKVKIKHSISAYFVPRIEKLQADNNYSSNNSTNTNSINWKSLNQ